MGRGFSDEGGGCGGVDIPLCVHVSQCACESACVCVCMCVGVCASICMLLFCSIASC